MNYTKKLMLCAALLNAALLFSPAIVRGEFQSDSTVTSSNADERTLSDIIRSCADRIYCQAELSSGGTNGQDYQKVMAEHVAQCKALLQKKNVSINHRDDNGVTPLMKAASYHQWEIIQLLIKAGADVTLADRKGRTALDYAHLRSSLFFALLHQDLSILMMKFIMGSYYTKARYNACVTLLTPNVVKQIWYKRWIF